MECFLLQLILFSKTDWLPMSMSSLGTLIADFMSLPFYSEITLCLGFLPVVTFMDHLFAYVLHFSDGCVLKGSLVLRYSGGDRFI